MNLYKVQGLVVKQYNVREADKIIVAITKEKGRIRFIARGIKKPLSRLSAGTQLFVCSDFLIIKGKNLDILRQTQPIFTYKGIKEDLNKMAWVSYLLEIAMEFFQDGQPNEELWDLTMNSLDEINIKSHYEAISLSYLVKLLMIEGIYPNFEGCNQCLGEVKGKAFFDYGLGGIICSKCLKNNQLGIIINKGTIETLKALGRLDFDRLDILKIPKAVNDTLKNLLWQYISYKIEMIPKSLEFLKLMTKEDGLNWI